MSAGCQRKNIAENYVSHLISLSFEHKHTHTHILSCSQQKGDILKFTNINHPRRWPKVAFLCITNGHLSQESCFSTMMGGNKSNSNHWHFLDEGSGLHRSWGHPCPAPLSLWQRQIKHVIYSWVSILFIKELHNWEKRNGLIEVKVSVVTDFNRTRIFPTKIGEITCLCKGTLTISGTLIFWQVSSKNEVVQAVEIGWKAVIPFGIIPHLQQLKNWNNLGDKLLLITFWFVLLAQMKHSMVVIWSHKLYKLKSHD